MATGEEIPYKNFLGRLIWGRVYIPIYAAADQVQTGKICEESESENEIAFPSVRPSVYILHLLNWLTFDLDVLYMWVGQKEYARLKATSNL